jgi:GTP cyclohydrolase IIa
MIQLTIIKINGYGPWTLTLGSDREHELQMLQASLYKEVQKLFSEKNCIVFLNRSDEFFAITNCLSLDDHIEIQEKLETIFDLKLSMSIGYAESPFDANLKAHDGKKSEVFLNRKHNIYGFLNGKTDQKVTIMHLDVEDLTSTRKTKSPYEISSSIFKLYAKMSEFFLNKKAMTFFVGGDNFMVVSSENSKENAREFLDLIKKEQGITLNCGIGTGTTSREAIKLATKSLDTIRKIRDSGKEKPEIYEMS